MESIIKKIYYGDLHPCEEPTPDTEQYIQNRKSICNIEEQILSQDPDCENLLAQYKDALHVESQYECEADFVRGFQIGAQTMIEVLTLIKDDI